MLECVILAALAFSHFPPVLCLTPGAALPAPQEVKGTSKGETGKQQKKKEEEEEEKEKPPEYPPLKPLHRAQAKRLFTAFKNKNPEKRKEAEDTMIAIGRGTVPSLIEKGGTRQKDQGTCIYRCLLALLDERDVYTLKECYRSKTERMRMLAVVCMAGLKNPKHIDFLKAALEDREEAIRLEAALGLLALKDPAGIGVIILNVAKNRKNPPKRLMKDLPLLKGKVYDSLFTPYLIKHDDPEVKIAATLVITQIGDTRLKTVLGRALDDSHNLVQGAAVNSLRALLHHEEPKNYSNVFELVEEVNQWKKELGIIR